MSIRRIFPTRIGQRLPQPIRLLIRGLTLIRLHLRLLRRDWKRMPKISRQCIIMAIVGHLLTLVPYLLSKLFHEWTYGNADWFLSPSFKYPRARYWYFKDTANSLLLIIAWLIIVKVASKFSDVLFLAFLIFLGYQIIDLILYWVDFNTEFWVYVDMLWTIIVLIKTGIYPYQPEKFARIKSLF
jgi:hypothetical protein